MVAAATGEGRRGWALLRASLHDPLLVINIESEVEGGARATAAQVCTASHAACCALCILQMCLNSEYGHVLCRQHVCSTLTD